VPGWVSRFKLIGVMAPKPHTASALDAAPGIALITLDGKPPRAYRVGSRIDGELMLRAVAQRSAQIGAADGSAAWMFELAPLPAPATGSLRNAGAAGMAPGREAPPLQPAPPGMSMMGMPPGQPAPQPMPPPEAPIPEAVGGVPGNDPSLRR
jgi:general secretion pathway protein C